MKTEQSPELLAQHLAIVGKTGSGKHFPVLGSPDSLRAPTELDCAWAAGFFDGEGTVTIAQGRRAGSQWPIYNMRVIIGQNELAPLLWVRERWGGTIVGRAAYGTRKQHHTWNAFARGAAAFLADLLPFLQVKYKRAELAINFQSRMQPPGSNANRAELRPFFAACREEMLTLNAYPRRTVQ